MINQCLDLIKEQYFLHKQFYRYLVISIFVTIIDIITSRVSELFVDILIANSIGIFIGFFVQYLLTSKYVYNRKKMSTFIKFFVTFLLGFILANGIVYVCRYMIFKESKSIIAFIVSKGLSIVIPFFVMYFIRKSWIKTDNSISI